MSDETANPNRIGDGTGDAQLSLKPVAAAVQPPDVSPTGKPLVPAWVVPYLMSIAGLAGGIAIIDTATLSFLPTSILTVLVAVKGIAGLVALLSMLLLGGSPGLRKAPPTVPPTPPSP